MKLMLKSWQLDFQSQWNVKDRLLMESSPKKNLKRANYWSVDEQSTSSGLRRSILCKTGDGLTASFWYYNALIYFIGTSGPWYLGIPLQAKIISKNLFIKKYQKIGVYHIFMCKTYIYSFIMYNNIIIGNKVKLKNISKK